jgi:hypothetical protein
LVGGRKTNQRLASQFLAGSLKRNQTTLLICLYCLKAIFRVKHLSGLLHFIIEVAAAVFAFSVKLFILLAQDHPNGCLECLKKNCRLTDVDP